MEIIRNLTRRKLRNFLTISGIVIGVLALVTMGSLAEKFNALLAGGATYFGSNIQIADDSSSAGFGSGFMPISKVDEVAAVDGVAARARSSSGPTSRASSRRRLAIRSTFPFGPRTPSLTSLTTPSPWWAS